MGMAHKTIDMRKPSSLKSVFLGAAVLSAGLAFAGCGGAQEPAKMGVTTTAIPNKMRGDSDLDKKPLTRLNATEAEITYKTEKFIVKAGDSIPLYQGNTCTEVQKVKVTKVDDKGVEFEDGFRMDYGAERKIGEFSLTIVYKAEKLPGNTAQIEVTYPIVEQKKTTKEKISP